MVELMVVVGIAAVMAGLAVAGLQTVKSRGTFASGANEIVGAVNLTRATAHGRGANTAFVIDTIMGRYWGIQTTSAFVLDTFDPATANIFVSGTLPDGVSFGPVAGYGATLPVPLSGIPTTGSLSYKYCSFCLSTGALPGYGSMLFDPGGQVTFSGGPSTIGQQFTVTSSRDVVRKMAVTVVARTGAVEIFEP